MNPNAFLFLSGVVFGVGATLGGARIAAWLDERKLRRALGRFEMQQRDWLLVQYFTPRLVPETRGEMVAEETERHGMTCPCGMCVIERMRRTRDGRLN